MGLAHSFSPSSPLPRAQCSVQAGCQSRASGRPAVAPAVPRTFPQTDNSVPPVGPNYCKDYAGIMWDVCYRANMVVGSVGASSVEVLCGSDILHKPDVLTSPQISGGGSVQRDCKGSALRPAASTGSTKFFSRSSAETEAAGINIWL